MALPFYLCSCDKCYTFKVVNHSQGIKMYGGYIESDFVKQNYRCWQDIFTFD
jgi:hypothetical protein